MVMVAAEKQYTQQRIRDSSFCCMNKPACAGSRFMTNESDRLDVVLALIKQLESALLGLRQVRGYVAKGAGLDTLETLISELEVNLAQLKRRLTQ